MVQTVATDVPSKPAAREPEHWRVAGGSIKERLDSWSEILATTHLAFEVHATDRTPADFRATVTRRPIGDLMLVDCAASPFLGHRSRAVMSSEAKHEEILGFQLVCKGIETVSEGSRGLSLTPGDVVLWDGLQPTDVEIVEAFHKRTLLFPRDRVLAVCPRLAELRALPPLDGSGPARLLVRYMNALALEQPWLEGAAGVAAANAAAASSLGCSSASAFM